MSISERNYRPLFLNPPCCAACAKYHAPHQLKEKKEKKEKKKKTLLVCVCVCCVLCMLCPTVKKSNESKKLCKITIFQMFAKPKCFVPLIPTETKMKKKKGNGKLLNKCIE